MIKRTLPIVLFIMAMAIGNAQWKRVKGNGNVIDMERSVGEYDKISLGGWFHVTLVPGQEGQLTLTGESNLLEYVKTEVKDGKLLIRQKKGVNLKPSNWKKGITIEVPVEEINGVSLSGSGTIVSKTSLEAAEFSTSISGSGDISLKVNANTVKASMSGSGDMDLSGKTTDFDISVSGSGDINAYGLKADFVKAQVSGSADLMVTAHQLLKARVSGSGDISYKGNPKKVDTKVSGSGDIKSL